MSITTLLRGTALSLCLATGASAFDLSAMTEAEKEAFGEAVREYLLSDPQVIMDAVAVLEQMEQAQQAQADVSLVSDNLDRLINDGFSHVSGNPEGDVTIVEFVDYRCGFCRKAHPEVAELVKSDGNIRLITKEFPILGQASMVSSRFAIATQIVQGEEAYKAVSDALITLEGAPNDAALTRLAETLGYNAETIMAEMDSDEVNRRITEVRALAQTMQISGTPTFVFGDQLVRGYAPLDAMRQIIEEERS